MRKQLQGTFTTLHAPADSGSELDAYRVEEGVLVDDGENLKYTTREARFNREFDPGLPTSEHPPLRCAHHTPAELGVDTSVHVRYATPKRSTT